MTNQEQQTVLLEARRWLRTPYAHQGAVLGVGVDCVMLLACVYHAACVLPWVDPRPYPMDWMLHRGDEIYLDGLAQHADVCNDAPQPGDIAMFKVGRTHSHGAIVTNWPEIIHAYRPAGMVTLDRADSAALGSRLGSIWRPRSTGSAET